MKTESQIVWPEGQILPTFPASAQTQDLIYLDATATDDEKYLFSSLKGIVNRKQPRIFSFEGDAQAEGAYAWFNALGVNYVEHTDPWVILRKYLSEVSGLIVFDPKQIDTVNLATIMAKDKNALVVPPAMLPILTAEPYSLTVLEDLRGRFTSKLGVYQSIFDNQWQTADRRILIGLNPNNRAHIREYATALGATCVWLNPALAEENALLARFFSSMPKGGNYLGWWPEEQAGVTFASTFGIPVIASDFSSNLTFHSGTSRTVKAKPMPAKPKLENKIYVAFILSDGDNLQYIEHLMRKLWKSNDRGSVPIGWTVSPAMVDAMPGALNFYHQSGTDNDNLLCGPSGLGYTYPNDWTNADDLNRYIRQSEEYNKVSGLRVITIWNTITGGISQRVGEAFAQHAPSTLGLTKQNTGGTFSVYLDSLPGKPLTCNYCTDKQAIINSINNASKKWNGQSPMFLLIQAQPWKDVTATTFKNVAASLTQNHVVIRPDQLFLLIRETNGLSLTPGGTEGAGAGLTGTYFRGKDFGTEVGSRVDAGIDFDWGTQPPVPNVEANDFSVRWTGKIKARYSGEYTLYATSDNLCRVWVNEQLVIDKTSDMYETAKGEIDMAAGKEVTIKAEYISGANDAGCSLEWASPFQPREVIPGNQLYIA